MHLGHRCSPLPGYQALQISVRHHLAIHSQFWTNFVPSLQVIPRPEMIMTCTHSTTSDWRIVQTDRRRMPTWPRCDSRGCSTPPPGCARTRSPTLISEHVLCVL